MEMLADEGSHTDQTDHINLNNHTRHTLPICRYVKCKRFMYKQFVIQCILLQSSRKLPVYISIKR